MARHRSLSELCYQVSADVLYAIELLESRYGASDYQDSGH
jgi:hypothetical protein